MKERFRTAFTTKRGWLGLSLIGLFVVVGLFAIFDQTQYATGYLARVTGKEGWCGLLDDEPSVEAELDSGRFSTLLDLDFCRERQSVLGLWIDVAARPVPCERALDGVKETGNLPCLRVSGWKPKGQ